MRLTVIALSLLAFLTPVLALAQEDEDNSGIEEIIISSSSREDPTIATPLTEQLLNMPGGLGDPMRAIFSLPGVVEANEGGQPAVRGSGPDDNSFLIDFLPASYVFHDFGNSIFNENLIRDFGLNAAGFGAQYSQATGAVFDVSLREPRQQPLSAILDASFLQAGVFVEGEVTDNQAFYFSTRESLVHLLLEAIDTSDTEEEEDFSFSGYPRSNDYQAKYSWTPNDNHRISLLALGASDRIALDFGSNSDLGLIDPARTGLASIDTSFNSLGLRWDYTGQNSELKTGIGRLDDIRRDRVGSGAEFAETDTLSWTAKSHYTRYLNDAHTLTVGGEHQDQAFDYNIRLRYQSCSEFDPACEVEAGNLIEAVSQQDIATSRFFLQDIWQINNTLALTAGVQFSQDDYLNERFTEPRLEAQWSLNDNWRLLASWGQYHQLPQIDQIIPEFGNPELSSPEATHYVVGTRTVFNQGWSADLDFYYKDLKNLAVNVDDPRNYVNAATGEAYGAEFMIRRAQLDNWYGWFSLSYARTRRTNNLNNTTANADYDTPLVANLVFNYQLGRWNLGMRWNMRSGLPYTPITGNRENESFPGFFLPVYGELNSERADPYHRLDLRAERAFNWGSRISGSFYFDIINAYNRHNGGSVEYQPIPASSEFELEERESLPLLPSVGIKLIF